MEKLVIKGGKKLKGTVSVSGSKNVALKALIAGCLTDEEVIINNIPLISDFRVMLGIIKDLGGKISINDHRVTVDAKNLKKKKISFHEAAKIRTSVMFMAPLLAKFGKAIVPNPGGCRIGARPIDRTVNGLKKMGFKTTYKSEDGYFYIEKKRNMSSKIVRYKFDKSTHTGTETLMMIASLMYGTKTILDNAAEEPEIDELIIFLNQIGAKIVRTKTRTIEVEGVEKLKGGTFEISPDRNEIVTFAIAGIVTKGDVLIKDADKVNLSSFIQRLEASGGGAEKKKGGIRFYYKDKIESVDVMTSFYPGFMTDWQGPWAVLMTQAVGESVIHETVYESRFGYVKELRKMGAEITFFNPKVKNPNALYNFNLEDKNPDYFHAIKIKGQKDLHNAALEVSDLRAGATLVLAALIAKGECVVSGVGHLDRGYEQFEKRLKSLGADIKRVKN
jgi:UDP-N-acetylglucosamine 1-carboxyvinyltransferase